MTLAPGQRASRRFSVIGALPLAGMRRALLLLLLVTASADHYRTLSVPRKATQDEIKAAYRRLARVHHPDKPDGCHERFRKINEAHEVLSNPQRRREYDASLRNPFAQAGGSGGFQPGGFQPGSSQPGYGHSFEFDPRFEAFFGRRPREAQKTREELKPTSPAVRIFSCDLHELDSGCVKSLTLEDSWLNRLRDAISEGRGGRAAQVVEQAAQNAALVAASLILRGYGHLLWGWGRWWLRLPLYVAAFAGYISQQLPPSPSGVYEIRVKPGWRAGTKVTFARGARHVTFRLRETAPHGLVRRRDDLVYTARLTRAEAARGVTLAVPRLNGEAWSVELQPGEAHEGFSRRFNGGGMPIKGGPARGDLLVEVRIVGAGA